MSPPTELPATAMRLPTKSRPARARQSASTTPESAVDRDPRYQSRSRICPPIPLGPFFSVSHKIAKRSPLSPPGRSSVRSDRDLPADFDDRFDRQFEIFG